MLYREVSKLRIAAANYRESIRKRRAIGVRFLAAHLIEKKTGDFLEWWKAIRGKRGQRSYFQRPCDFITVKPAAKVPKSVVRYKGNPPKFVAKAFSYKAKESSSPFGYCRLKRGYLVSNNGWVHDSDYRWLRGFWSEAVQDEEIVRPIEREIRFQDARKIEGKCFSLLAPWTDNYYHWISQVLPRLALQENMPDFHEMDFFLVPEPIRSYQLEMLNFFGVDTKKLITLGEYDVVNPAECIVPTIPGENRYITPWAVDYMRRKCGLALGANGSRRIFVNRDNSTRRRILNLASVEALVNAHGFEIVFTDKLSFEQQVKVFSSASTVCGVHGAGLSNSVFCSPGSTLIELIPTNFVLPCFGRLSAACGLDYRFVVGTEPRPPLFPQLIPDADTVVDVLELERLLNELAVKD